MLRPDVTTFLNDGLKSRIPEDIASLKIYDEFVNELNELKPTIIEWNKENMQKSFMQGAATGALMGGLVGRRFGIFGSIAGTLGGALIGGVGSFLTNLE